MKISRHYFLIKSPSERKVNLILFSHLLRAQSRNKKKKMNKSKMRREDMAAMTSRSSLVTCDKTISKQRLKGEGK
jgi:hypothetical protein